MRINPIVIITVVILGCGEQNKEVVSAKVPSRELDSLIAEAKWRIYCYHLRDTIKWSRYADLDTTLTVASLDLTVDTIQHIGDTVEVDFKYSSPLFAKGSTPIDNRCMLYGVGFVKPSNRIDYVATRCNFLFSPTTHPDGIKFMNPIRPEVVAYIQNDKDKLSTWFRKEAIKRKVLN